MNRFLSPLIGVLGLTLVLVPSLRAELDWQECLQTALEKSPRLAQARAGISQQEGFALSTRAALLPSLNMTLLAYPPVATFNLEQSILNLPAWSLNQSGKSRVTAARINYELELWRLIEELRAAYLQVEYRQKRLEIRVLFGEDLNSKFVEIRDMVTAGQAREVDLRRLEVNLSLARNSINESRVELDQAWLDLTELMGLSLKEVTAPPRVKSVFNPVTVANLQEKEWVATALSSRPDLRALEALRTTGQWQLKAIKYRGFPVVTAVADSRLAPDAGNILGDIGVGRNDDNEPLQSNFYFGANFNWVIWDAGERRGETQEARSQLEGADVKIRQLRQLSIPNQIKKALNALQAAEASYQSVNNPQMDSDYRKDAAKLAEIGRITRLEALEVSRDQLTRQETLLQAQYRLELARLGLQTASGQAIEYRNAPSAARP